jgi:hypothetical protein
MNAYVISDYVFNEFDNILQVFTKKDYIKMGFDITNIPILTTNDIKKDNVIVVRLLKGELILHKLIVPGIGLYINYD